MSNSKSKLKKIICSLVLCLGLLVSGLVGSSHANINTILRVNASASGNITDDVTSDLFGSGYYDFDVKTSEKPNTSITGWSRNGNSDDATKNNIKYGVVDLNKDNNTSFDNEEWGISTRPEMDNNNITDDAYYKNLMINASTISSKFGFTSSSLSLEANSYYKISVNLLTYNIDGLSPNAAIYLQDNNLDEDDEDYIISKFENINTLSNWNTYFFYIDTNNESKNVKLDLWLGSKETKSKGAVFFNEVEILRYSEASYYNITSTKVDNDNDTFNIIHNANEFSKPFDSTDTTNNSSFENPSLVWSTVCQNSTYNQTCKIVSVDSSITSNDLVISAPKSNGSINNSSALFMHNKIDGYQAVESPDITIAKQSYYRLSFWAKSDCGIGKGATVQLVDKSETDAIDNASITLATELTTNSFHNNWSQYSFYIYGASLSDTQVAVQIWLGTEETKTSGYVFVDDFRLEQIDYTTYTSNSSSSNSATFNLNESSDKFTITNGEFNITNNASSSTNYPLAPASWTSSITRDGSTFNGSGVYSGVIDTNPEHFNANKFTENSKYGKDAEHLPTCPPAINEEDSHNNVLMIGSSDNLISQTYTSNTFTLTADSYYNVSLYVMTDYLRSSSNNNCGARITITSDTKTIYDLYNVFYENGKWNKISVNIRTGVNDETAKIALTFEGCTGHIFIDKVELRTITQSIYDNEISSPSTQSIDLTYENFDNKTFGKIPSINGIETPNNWKSGSEEYEESVLSGIINKNSNYLEQLNVPQSGSKENNYLYISSAHDGNYYYTSKESYSFKSETFYKISINILTSGINRVDTNSNDTDGEIIYGASISLADSNEIVLKGINTNSNWTTYTIYVSFTEEVTSAIKLSLGYTDEECAGTVLFDKLVISTFESEEDFDAEIDEAPEGTFAKFKNYTPPVEDDEEESTPWSSSFNWIILPSLITGIAIIIAVIGYYIRKININRKPKIKTNYDRRKTLDKDIDKREKIALRKQIIEELRAELSGIDQEIADFNVLAEAKLNEVREQIHAEQEQLKKEKLEIEIRKKEATANREKQLKESPDFVSNTKAEKEYNNFIAKLDRQEMTIQRKLSDQEFKLATAREVNNEKLSRYIARQEYIRLQIAKIEAEIEEIARQEEEMWAEYKAAKADAKRRKAEYKAQIKAEKEKKALSKKTSSPSKMSSKKTTNSQTKKDNTEKIEKTTENIDSKK